MISESRIGFACAIGRNSLVRQSLVNDSTKIKAECRVTDSVLGRHVMMGSRVAVFQTEIGDFSYCWGDSVVCWTKIGKFCSIAQGLLSGLGEHPTDFVTTSRAFYSSLSHAGSLFTDEIHFPENQRVKIGNDVWVGSRVFIRNGVTIGDGAIIGAGSVVVQDIEPYSISAGVPARHLKFRFSPVIIQKLLALRWWDWDTERLKAAAPLLSQSDPFQFLEWAGRDICNGDLTRRKEEAVSSRDAPEK